MCIVAPVNVDPETVATIESSIENVVDVRFKPEPDEYVVLVSVDVIVIAPFEAEAIDTLFPAIRYEEPSTSCVRDPDNPWLCNVAPVNVDPDTVATIESSIENVVDVRFKPEPAEYVVSVSVSVDDIVI